MNLKRTTLFVFTLMVLLTTVTAISATDTADDNIVSVNDTVDDTVLETVDSDADDVDNNVVTEVTSDKNLKTESNTYVVTNDTLGTYFDLENTTGVQGGLLSTVSEGDVLDIQSDLNLTTGLTINNAVNITSTTGATITLNGGYFTVNSEGSYSNITNINFYNTQIYVTGTTQVTFDNINATVVNASIGTNIGQFSIRDGSTYVTVKNSNIYTEGSGSSSLVLAYANYCTIDNCNITGVGSVGNLLYLTTYNVDIPDDAVFNSYNNITNCNITGPSTYSAICYAIALTGVENIFENNTINYVGTGLNRQSSYTGALSALFVNNNWVVNTSYVYLVKNSTYVNNTIGIAYISSANDIELINNTIANITSTGNNINITGNTITGTVNIGSQWVSYSNYTITNNTIINDATYTISAYGSNMIISDNYLIAGSNVGDDSITHSGTNITLSGNTPVSETYTITDENYYNYFNDDGTIKESAITNYSTIILSGMFDNKKFIFKDLIATVTGSDAQLEGGVINITGTSKISLSNIFINSIAQDVDNAIIIESDGNTINNVNITFNGIEFKAIIVNGSSNTITNNKINATVLASNIDYSSSPSLAPSIGIVVLGSNNTLEYNTINMTATSSTGYYPTVDGIDIQGSSTAEASNNYLSDNFIYMNVTGYAYSIHIGDNASNTQVWYSYMYTNGTLGAYGIQASGDSTNYIIRSNTIRLNSTGLGYGIILGYWKDNNVNATIRSNLIYITADQVYGMEIYNVNSYSYIASNRITADGNYTMGIGVYNSSNLEIYNTRINATGTTNETAESYDYIKPTTVGITVIDSEAIDLEGTDYIDVTSGPGVTITNSNDIYLWYLYVYSDQTGVIINDSNDIEFYRGYYYTTDSSVKISNVTDLNVHEVDQFNSEAEYAIVIENTTGINVNNNKILSDNNYGDYAVYVADDCSDSQVYDNMPRDIELDIDYEDLTLLEENTITIVLDNTVSGTATVKIGEDEFQVSISNGEGTFTYTPTTLDAVDVEITFVPSDTSRYNPVTYNTQLEVLNVAYIDTTTTTTSGSTITLTQYIKVDGVEGEGYVIFKVNGKTLKDEDGNAIKVDVVDGIATYDYTVPSTSTTRDYEVSSVYAGEGMAIRSSTTITVNPASANIAISTEGTLKPGETVTFTATITDENGNAVTTGKVIFKLNGKTLRDADGNVIYGYVDANGVASIEYTIPDNYSAKDYVLTAVFTGSGFERSEANTTITLTKTNTKITASDITINKGDNTQLTATITDENGNPVTGTTKVAIKINGKTFTQVKVVDGVIDLTLYTNSFTNPTYTITIVAGENSYYNKAEASLTLTVVG